MPSTEGKSCSICNKWYRMSEYDYGNKTGRSYCQQCNKEEKAAYSRGGKEAATEYRDSIRKNNGLL
ncbi:MULTISPECIES: hypothetical protein [unclassified Marinobacter]|jgi:hypothetical protein|uniref:hypothetical protein n=1 Tax=unclassified Marinobacter TaxID=83889 RepID=UPI00200EE330|nr:MULTISPECIES: hypothetical protein [unclassified Marinobacter]MCL1476971.1 hypothetical protein [Marinobacter sp.]MCL1483397.1 hypothetical protein [Marinobacter sp.]MCL1487693.1 hypothetical protein [Marinobacter sp.]UQG57516.1 hypothetical protein MIH16_07725 [Marinobacter sp. M4C]UQG66321.1 hypothetical protein MIH17_07725 [Marinobacter sp. M2C]